MPDRDQIRAALSVMRGEQSGDRNVARRVLAAAGVDAENVTAVRDLAEMRSRMDREPEDVAPHWERTDKVYPQISREGALKILASRGVVPPARNTNGGRR